MNLTVCSSLPFDGVNSCRSQYSSILDIPVVVALTHVVDTNDILAMHARTIAEQTNIPLGNIFYIRNLINDPSETSEQKSVSAALCARLLSGVIQNAASRLSVLRPRSNQVVVDPDADGSASSSNSSGGSKKK